MRREMEWVLYGAAFLVFAAVVLWAREATWPLLVIFAGMGAILIAVLAWPEHRPKVLVVGEGAGAPTSQLQYALAHAGYDVCRCAGPIGRPCPVTLGRSCPLSERRPVAAVIFRRPDETGPLPPCGQALWVPSLAVEEGSPREPEIADRYGRVGGERGADAVVRTLEHMFGR